MLLVIMILWQSLERFKGFQPQKLPEFKWYWNLKPTWILSGLQQKQTLDVLKTVFNLMLDLLTMISFQPIRDRAWIWKSDKASDATFVTIIKWTQSIFNLSFEVPIFHVWRIPCNKKNWYRYPISSRILVPAGWLNRKINRG